MTSLFRADIILLVMIQQTEKLNFIYPEIGKKIKKFRENRKWTQAQLAEAVGLNRISVTNIENGRNKIFVHTLLSFCYALNINPIDLLPSKTNNQIDLEVHGLKNKEKKWINEIVKEVE